MSEPTKDGGPAFPADFTHKNIELGTLEDARCYGTAESGMSLRDWFAGMAMQGIMTRGDVSWASAGKMAYQAATVMLAAREKPHAD